MLRAWAESPSRFREDANAEEDLRLGGYRDRVIVELAQNAADAADGDGELDISVRDGQLCAANTGKALDADGVAALASLRASAKRGGETTGRFGVGFAAVLAVSEEPMLCSAAGGVRFSAERTRQAVRELADDVPRLGEELTARGAAVPVLRLPWPCSDPVPDGYASEVRLPLLAGVDADALLEQARSLAPDLLLALPGLGAITVAGERFAAHRSANSVQIGHSNWVVARSAGEVDQPAGLAAEETGRFSVTWAVEVDEQGVPLAHGQDVLHTPTPTDERLNLPARLLATVPMEPSRRRIRPGPAADAVFDAAVAAYPELLRAFPARQRTRLIPRPDFPVSEVDERLRQGLLERCRTTPLLPAADGGELAANSALVLEHPSRTLFSLLNGVLPGLLGEVDEPEALRALGVTTMGLAELTEACLGIERTPGWWRDLYAALATTLDAGADRDELGALPVPLLDGRTVPGPRGVLLPDERLAQLEGLTELGLPIAHPDAVHPLLTRLGAVRAGPDELLENSELRAAVERSIAEAQSGMDTEPLVDIVLRLVETGGGDWLGALALTDTDGTPRRADELLFPGARLLEVLDPEAIGPDAPLGVLADSLAERYSHEALRACGVLDGFAVIRDEEPTGPDHDLPDEEQWWEAAPEPGPRIVHGLRDLDLVADDAWERALTQIAEEPETWRSLIEPGGYTGWWIARYASLGERAPRDWRLSSATELAGLYPPYVSASLGTEVLRAAGVRSSARVESAEDAAGLLDALADAENTPSQPAVFTAHTELARAVAEHRFDYAVLDAPERVRALGGLLDAEQAVVVDAPWFYGTGFPELIAVELELASPLAELLDLPLASEELEAAVTGEGEPLELASLPAVRLAGELLGFEVPTERPLLHDSLEVTVADQRLAVPWWSTGQAVHLADTERGLARALAWMSGQWSARHRIEALLREPDPTGLLA